MVGVGGDTALHRGIPMGGWYGKREGGERGLHTLVPVKERG